MAVEFNLIIVLILVNALMGRGIRRTMVHQLAVVAPAMGQRRCIRCYRCCRSARAIQYQSRCGQIRIGDQWHFRQIIRIQYVVLKTRNIYIIYYVYLLSIFDIIYSI